MPQKPALSWISVYMLTALCVFCGNVLSYSQELYFPPAAGDQWETLSPSSLNWCPENIDTLYDFLANKNSKAFILLKDGKIVLEKYFGAFTPDSIWYWASAGKSLTAFMVGIAQQEGFLSISDKTSDYLGPGWTACTLPEEDAITIRHQLTMTTGLDDGVEDVYCTLDSCLVCIADPGTRWAYHNGPYTLLDGVLENATGQNLNLYTSLKLTPTTGITGLFVRVGYNNVFFSRPRSMARYGLLILNHGNWDGTQILQDEEYFSQMTNTSQSLNESYGYLWWLNGKPGFMVPGLQIVFPGSMFPDAPADMIAALGRDGQFINVVPSQNIVWIRMGNSPGEGLISATLNNDIWQMINALECTSSAIHEPPLSDANFNIFPNPVSNEIHINVNDQDIKSNIRIDLITTGGQIVTSRIFKGNTYLLTMDQQPQGVYLLRITTESGYYVKRIIKV